MFNKTGFVLSIAAAAMVAMSAVSPVAKAQDKIKLTLTGWSSSPAENTRLQEIVDTFNKSNKDNIVATLNQVPDYDTTLAKDLASGNPPDVFYVDSFRLPDLVQSKALLAIGDKLTDPADFFPSLKTAFTTGDSFYCPPKDFSTLALQINTEMFAKAGLKAPTTWEELAAAAKALNSDKVAGVVIPADFARSIAFLYQAGGEVTNADYTKMAINSPEGLAALKFYTGLYLDGVAKTPADLGAGWPGEAFGKGLAAISFEGNWIVPYLKDQFPTLKYESVELPAGPKGKATMAFTVCYATPTSGKNPEAAIKFINYLTGSDGMKAWTDLGLAMPTRMSLSKGWLDKYPNLSAYVAGAEYARKWQFVPGFGAVMDEINKQIQLIFANQATPEDALKEIEKVGNDILSKVKK